MIDEQLDSLARSLAAGASRRHVLKVLGGLTLGGLAALAGTGGGETSAAAPNATATPTPNGRAPTATPTVTATATPARPTPTTTPTPTGGQGEQPAQAGQAQQGSPVACGPDISNGTWCGACGVCRGGRCVPADRCGNCQVCARDASACVPIRDGPDPKSCGPPYNRFICCNGGCVDLWSDPRNCGSCGKVCGENQACYPPPDGCLCSGTGTGASAGCPADQQCCRGACYSLCPAGQ